MKSENAVTQQTAWSEPAKLLAIAIEKGIDVASLEKLQAMYERSQDRAAAQEFAEAMALFKSQCGPIPRNSVAKVTGRNGQQFSYHYAKLSDISRVIDPVLGRNGFSYSWDSVAHDRNLNVTCTVRHANGHSVASTFQVPTEASGGMNAQQAMGSALEYARRYSLTSALGISTGDDDDAVGASAAPNQGPVSAEQAEALLDAAQPLSEDDFTRLTSWLQVSTLGEVKASDFNRVLSAINAKIASRKPASEDDFTSLTRSAISAKTASGKPAEEA
jgi:hypothetical protein